MGRDPQDFRYTQVRLASIGEAVAELGAAMEGYRDLQVDITGMSVRGPAVRNGEFLITVRGVDHEGLPVVAFHGATDFGEALRGISARVNNGTMKWKADEYAR